MSTFVDLLDADNGRLKQEVIMRLIQPDPAAALLGLRAMKTVVSASGAIRRPSAP